MSNIEELTGELQTIAAGIDQAQTNTTGAETTADHEIAAFAGPDSAGIAAGMYAVRRSIAETRTRLASVGTSLNETVTAIAATPSEISPEQTIAALAPIPEKIGGIRDDVVAIIAKVEQT
jgi:hypothetical protein